MTTDPLDENEAAPALVAEAVIDDLEVVSGRTVECRCRRGTGGNAEPTGTTLSRC
jgi:hypothetical protein